VRDAAGCSVTVECSRFTLASVGSPSEPPASGERLQGTGAAQVAAILPVGMSLVRPTICISHDAPLPVAIHALAMEPGAHGIAVVDEGQRFVGMLARSIASVALIHSGSDSVAKHMITEWSAIDESASLGAAFSAMAAKHARELTVVGEGGAFVGFVRDIDALRFVAFVSRTGLRPRCERAA
jgi:predicted transcriptional regulator